MQMRSNTRGAIVASALTLLAACHDHSSSRAAAPLTVHGSVVESSAGPYARLGATSFVAIPGLGADFAPEPGSSLVETPDGRAFLTAVLARRAAPDERVALSLAFRDVLAPGSAGYAQHAAPHKELEPTAYRVAGGPVDETTWRYYRAASGELRGIGALSGTQADLAIADATGLQCGPGADNLDAALGASVRLALDGDTFTLAFAIRPSERTYAVTSPGDAALGGAPRSALSIPALGGGFDVVAGGSFVERADGTVRLDAVVAQTDSPERRFALTLVARDRRDAIAGAPIPAGSPQRDLDASAYRDAGGPIDANAWRYYAAVDGVLHGLEELAGAEIALRGGAFALQVGYGASGIDGELGACASLTALVLSQPVSGPALPWGGAEARLGATLRRAHVATADEPELDPLFGAAGGVALRVPGLAEDFVVVSGGEFCERADGRAELFAELASASAPDEQWTIGLQLSAPLHPGEPGGLPAGSPDRRLASAAYAENGGPIDTGEWHYYTAVAGELIGVGPRAGARIALAAAAPALQIGEGAHGANLRFGMLGGLAATLVAQPASGPALPSSFGAAEIALSLERVGDRCASAAARDLALCSPAGDAALTIAGLGDFVLLPGARLAEHADGSADLRGVVARGSDLSRRFLVEVRFLGRVDRGVPAPEGSPALAHCAAAYASNGGPIDPSTWHYYVATEGTLTGLGAWQGARLAVAREGTAFQVGGGASGRNARYGASGSVSIAVESQPASGPAISAATGAWNLALFDACP